MIRMAGHSVRRLILLAGCWSLLVTRIHAAEGIERCVSIPDPAVRLTCYDTGGARLSVDERSELDRRLETETLLDTQYFTIIPHRENYLLPLSYMTHVNRSPETPTQQQVTPWPGMKPVETKFQISFKTELMRNVMPPKTHLWFAYTQVSYFQIYDQDDSAPFRETDYEPEAFVQYKLPTRILGYDSQYLIAGFSHQSNGRPDPLSRSWNRIYVAAVYAKGPWAVLFKPWWRIPESRSSDNNPDLEAYMGYGELAVARKYNESTVKLVLHNNFRLDSDNRGSVLVSWSFPLDGRFKGYVEYFNGYGESLIDYNIHRQRFSLGITLTDIF